MDLKLMQAEPSAEERAAVVFRLPSGELGRYRRITVGAPEVSPGDEVILPPYTFVATLNVILQLNAMPVFDPEAS